MNWPEFAKRLLLDDGRIGLDETTLLKRAIQEDHALDREEMEFLVELKRSANSVHPEFDQFLFAALKKFILADGKISDHEAGWLRTVLFVDGIVHAEEKAFLKSLRQGAKSVGPEFRRLYEDCLGLDTSDFSDH